MIRLDSSETYTCNTMLRIKHTRMCENVNETTTTLWCRVISPLFFLQQRTWFTVLKHKEENAREKTTRHRPFRHHRRRRRRFWWCSMHTHTHAIRECPIGNAFFFSIGSFNLEPQNRCKRGDSLSLSVNLKRFSPFPISSRRS